MLKREWIAANDRRTRHWHSDLDGKIKDIDEPFENVIRLSKTKYLPDRIMYPGDPNAHPANVYNCRCTIAAKVFGYKNIPKEQTILTFKDKGSIIISDKQFGKKVGRHAMDYGLNPSEKSSRNQIIGIIYKIVDNADEVATGFFRGQLEDVDFYIYGSDVVIVNKDGEFVTLMKGGIDNGRVKNARRKKV